MTKPLHELLDAVCDEDSFATFIDALATDWFDEQEKEKAEPSSPYGPGANAWEHGTIGDYLAAAAAWAASSKGGLPLYEPPANPWKRFADILFAGKIYE